MPLATPPLAHPSIFPPRLSPTHLAPLSPIITPGPQGKGSQIPLPVLLPILMV